MKKAPGKTGVLNIVRPDTSGRAPEWLSRHDEDPFEIRLSTVPLSPHAVDIYLVHISHLPLFWKKGVSGGPPVIACGPSTLLETAFELGCSDYLKEPWSTEEFVIRCRRLFPCPRLPFRWGTVYLGDGELFCGAHQVALTYPEQKIIRLLVKYLNQPVHRETLQYALWGELRPGSRGVDVHVSALRRKFKLLSGNGLSESPIRTVHGVGYILITSSTL
jgi:DNA-binding winged helix-turn-helix (wHTH) protein